MAEHKEGMIRLGKIQVKMGDKQVDLTVEQARELCALLKGLFGDDATKIIHVKDYVYPAPWYFGQSWNYRGYYWTCDTKSIPCSSTTYGTTANSVTNITYTLTGG